MNVSSLIGLFAALSVFIYTVSGSASNREVFLNAHALIIVIGGTFAATLLSFPLGALANLLKVFWKKIFQSKIQPADELISEVVDLARGLRQDDQFLATKASSIRHPFLKEAVELELEGSVNSDEVDTILEMRALNQANRYEQEATMFKVIAKFPPAFGLMGTTVGMISLLQNLGTADAFKNIGPSMAIGLVATFYGIAIANLIFIPVGESLSKINKQDEVLRQIVIQGVQLLRAKSHPIVVEEYLKSFLLPRERVNLKKAA